MELTFDIKKINVVPIDKVRPNSWNPKDKDTPEYRKIVEGVKAKGLRAPIVVRDNKGYEIIDGEQRWTACKELGFKNVIIYNEGVCEDDEAKALTIWYQQQVPFERVSEAKLVAELSKIPNLVLPYTPLELEELQQLANFDFNDYATERPEFEDEVRTINVKVTLSQYEVIRAAIAQVEKVDNCTEGQALERICADYIGGYGVTDPTDQE